LHPQGEPSGGWPNPPDGLKIVPFKNGDNHAGALLARPPLFTSVLPADYTRIAAAAHVKQFARREVAVNGDQLFGGRLRHAIDGGIRRARGLPGNVAEAHAGLAEVRERTGDVVAARREARAALDQAPSAEAYLVLGRLDFAANRLDDASKEAGNALRIDPQSRAAQELSRQIESKAGQKKE